MKTEKISSESKSPNTRPAHFDTPGTSAEPFEMPGASAEPLDTPDSARPTNFDTPDTSAEPFEMPGASAELFETSGAECARPEQRKPAGGQSERGRPERGQSECARPECGRAAAFVSPANVLASMRIALSGVMLLLEPFCAAFYCVYALAGLTDMLDGTVARKTGTESRLGTTLDSAADFVFVGAACVKLLPAYWEQIPGWLLISAAFVFYLKVKNLIACFVMHKKIVTMHTVLNRAAGILLFAFPFASIMLPIPVYGGICAVAVFAATVDSFAKMVAKAF